MCGRKRESSKATSATHALPPTHLPPSLPACPTQKHARAHNVHLLTSQFFFLSSPIHNRPHKKKTYQKTNPTLNDTTQPTLKNNNLRGHYVSSLLKQPQKHRPHPLNNNTQPSQWPPRGHCAHPVGDPRRKDGRERAPAQRRGRADRAGAQRNHQQRQRAAPGASGERCLFVCSFFGPLVGPRKINRHSYKLA